MHPRAHVALTFITVGFAGSLIKRVEETLEIRNPRTETHGLDHLLLLDKGNLAVDGIQNTY